MTFSDIILKWPSTAEFARDLEVTVDLASKWRRGRGVPSGYWGRLLAAAEKRGLSVSAADLVTAAANMATAKV